MMVKARLWLALASAAVAATLLLALGGGRASPGLSLSVAPGFDQGAPVALGSSQYADTDQDGCDDMLELYADPMSGGGRAPDSFWDFFDPNRDGAVSGLDFFPVLGRFNATAPSYPAPPSAQDALAEALSPAPPPPAYHAGHDRTVPGPNGDPWDTRAPDGAISGIDVFLVLKQFNHSCQQAWRPNVVVIMTDDQDDMGSMSVMPKVEQLLADEGVVFTNSFVDFPLCCPARASFLTGQAAHNHGVLDNVPPDGGYARLLPTEGNTLPVWLHQAGYVTALIGKYLNGYGSGDATHVPPGWDTWNGVPHGLGKHEYYNYTINEDGTLHAYGSSPSDYQTDVLAQKAADFISTREGSSQPFFLWLAPLAPHSAGTGFFPEPAPRHSGTFAGLPLPQPPNFNEEDVADKPGFIQALPKMDAGSVTLTTESFRKRRESLLAVDDMVERVVAALMNAGKLANTMIVFTSDNGYSHGEHRRVLGKGLVYEENIRVPLIIRGPGIPTDETQDQLVNNLDLVATIMELAGATPGRTLDGRSLTAVLSDGSAPWRSALLVQGLDTVGPNGNAYGRYQGVRTANYVYAEHQAPDGPVEQELYDLAADPYQLTSQHNNPDYTAIRNTLQTLLGILRSCAGETCWVDAPVP